MVILVTGATGAVGSSVVHVLHAAGHQIRTLSLDPPQKGLLPDDTEVRAGDVTDPVTAESAVQGVDTVIHLAALLHIVDPSPALREKYERINVGGTAIMLKFALQAGVKRFILFSTIAVYGYSKGKILTEHSMPIPDTFYAKTKLNAEQIVLAAKRSDGQPFGIVLRMGAIYGARIKGNYMKLLQSIARNRFLPIGNGHNRRALIYDRDAASAALLAAYHPAASGKVFNVTDGQFHTLSEIIATICEQLGRKPPRMSLPAGPVRLAAGIVEDITRLIRRNSPITRAMIDKYSEDVAVDSSLIRTELGFIPQYDLSAGWQETIQKMRATGQL